MIVRGSVGLPGEFGRWEEPVWWFERVLRSGGKGERIFPKKGIPLRLHPCVRSSLRTPFGPVFLSNRGVHSENTQRAVVPCQSRVFLRHFTSQDPDIPFPREESRGESVVRVIRSGRSKHVAGVCRARERYPPASWPSFVEGEGSGGGGGGRFLGK